MRHQTFLFLISPPPNISPHISSHASTLHMLFNHRCIHNRTSMSRQLRLPQPLTRNHLREPSPRLTHGATGVIMSWNTQGPLSLDKLTGQMLTTTRHYSFRSHAAAMQGQSASFFFLTGALMQQLLGLEPSTPRPLPGNGGNGWLLPINPQVAWLIGCKWILVFFH